MVTVALVLVVVVLVIEFVRFPIVFKVAFMDVALVRFVFVGGILICANVGLRP
jgi:hypothetical protein